jgi:hypothetical protein
MEGTWQGYLAQAQTFLTPSAETATAFKAAAPMIGILGAVNSAIGGYYSAKSQQYQLKSQALSLEFQQSMSQINARQSEYQAQSILQAGERQIGQLTMRYGKAQGARRASTAAAGVSLGVGSTAEVEASQNIAKEIDSLTISANSVRASEEARMRKVGFENQALMQGVSAANLSASAGTISPLGVGATSLIGSASSLATNWFRDKSIESLLARQSV